jgi:tyrosyl-tRNA synthetase
VKPHEQVEQLSQHVSEIISKDAFLQKITTSHQNKKPLRIKAGFDPSAPDIHLGHTVLLSKLRQFQDMGHQVVYIIGDATARIGDPSGVSKSRPALSEDEVKRNAKTYQDQAFKILDRNKTETVYNSRWFGDMGFNDILGLISRVTVRQIIDRDDFQKRMSKGLPVSMMELFYPLMQAFDSVKVKADVELGGTDQKFNLLLGRDLQREWGQAPQAIMTLPLLVGLDGHQKMSKSSNNHIALMDSPKDMFGKLMSISDELMISYYELLTDENIAQLKKDLKSDKIHPKSVKENLAERVTARFWGKAKAKESRGEFQRVFAKGDKPRDLPLVELEKGDYELVPLMVQHGLASSANDARRLIKQNAVSVDDERISDPKHSVVVNKEIFIKVGKKRFAIFKPKSK